MKQERPISLGHGIEYRIRAAPAVKQQRRDRPGKAQQSTGPVGGTGHERKTQQDSGGKTAQEGGQFPLILSRLTAGHPIQQMSVADSEPPQSAEYSGESHIALHRQEEHLRTCPEKIAGKTGIDTGMVPAKAALSPSPEQLCRRQQKLGCHVEQCCQKGGGKERASSQQTHYESEKRGGLDQ